MCKHECVLNGSININLARHLFLRTFVHVKMNIIMLVTT